MAPPRSGRHVAHDEVFSFSWGAQTEVGTGSPLTRMGRTDIPLSMMLARAVEQRAADFNPQNVANTAWASATVASLNAKLFAVLVTLKWKYSLTFCFFCVSKMLVLILAVFLRFDL